MLVPDGMYLTEDDESSYLTLHSEGHLPGDRRTGIPHD
jgi:hypothetical protein